MMFASKPFCLGMIAALLSGGLAQAQEACSTHTVVRGDNLRQIARAAYGDPDLFRVIYDANIAIIGPKADLIEIGARLVIPCSPDADTAAVPAAVPQAESAPVPAAAPAAGEPGELAAIPLPAEVIDPARQPVQLVPELPFATVGQAAAAPVIEAAPQAAATPAPLAGVVAAPEAPAEPMTEAAIQPVAAAPAAGLPVLTGGAPVRLLTGNGHAPFVDEMLPGGGMFTQLVEMAIFRADPAIPYKLTFVNDWQAHIDALLPSQAYDLSFPWIRPDCEATGLLSAGDRGRCEDFAFSAPFYEIVDGFFARADSELVAATSHTLFEGRRICRPEGYTTGVLDARGLRVPVIELLRPASVVDCFEALAAGRVDLVSIDAEVGDSAIAELGMTGAFLQNPHLMTLQSLHVIAHKSNPRALAMLQQLNIGVVEMYESGEWFEIVSSALAQGGSRQ